MRFLSAIGAPFRSVHREQANRQEQRHRIVVLGAGYAGVYVAGDLARRLSPADTEITVVNAVRDFVERLRMHQLAAGRELEAQSSPTSSRGRGYGCARPVSPPSSPSTPSTSPAGPRRCACARLDRRGDGGSVLVVRDGLTGIETATEITTGFGLSRGRRQVASHPQYAAAPPELLIPGG
ncbi:hypothetical protein GCM10020219_080850 [Nonomuraea dietziae]